MGGAKSWWMEQQERGFYSVGDKYICADCIGDDDIKEFINVNATYDRCDYCGKSEPETSVHFDEFMGFVLQGISSEYEDPNNEGVPWEKGWMGDVYDTYDLVYEEIGLEADEPVLDDIISSLSDRQWCQRGFFQLKPKDVLKYGWNEFVRLVKHKARYVFYRADDSESSTRGYEEIPPGQFLDALCSAIDNAGLHKTIKKGAYIYRVRIHAESEYPSSSKELGPPPYEYALYSNRMSPSGIPMFYGAFDVTTAVKETYTATGRNKTATVGQFELLRDLNFIDISNLPAVPGLFSPDSRDKRHSLMFLRGFAHDISQPVLKDGREHIDYVPTQIVSEHIRHIYKTPDNAAIDGIIYKSSKEGANDACVIFIENEDCCNSGDDCSGAVLALTHVERIDPEGYI